MKKSIVCMFLIAVGSLAFACGRGGPGGDSYWGHGFGMGYGMGCYDDRASMMGDLGVTGEQANKIAEIDAKYRRLYYENRGNFDKINTLRQEHRKAIDGVLNDSQRNRFGNMYDRRWSGWGRGYGRRHMGDYYGQGYGMGYCSGLYSSVEYMRQDLGLTDAQAKKIAEIDSKYRDLYNKNRDDYNRIDSLRLDHRKAIVNVLTPEQRKKFSGAYDSRWRGWGPGRGRGMGPGMMGY
jgi:Spy/CpxP family protein refolding chaperone